MTITLEKLTYYWKKKDAVIKAENEKYNNRVEDIFNAITQIENIENINEFLSILTDEVVIENVPEGGKREYSFNYMETLIDEKFEDNEAAKAKEVFKTIVSLLNLDNTRNADFRVSSNAKKTDHETLNTTISYMNPESYFTSYNSPFSIVKFIQDCKNNDKCSNDLSYYKEVNQQNRFITKYLWMLANRDKYIPILSLRSFYNLIDLFKEVDETINWNINEYNWEMSFEDFRKKWGNVSDQIKNKLNYIENREEGHETLAKFLFSLSLHNINTRNINGLLTTGNKAVILYGPPGTGKTYLAEKTAKELINQHSSQISSDTITKVGQSEKNESHKFSDVFPVDNININIDNASSEFENIDKSKAYYEIVQFHPSYCYQDFIGGIVPDIEKNVLRYTLKKGIFTRFCKAAEISKDKNNNENPPPFILIIDEINRANLSDVFGELLYGLEYRDTSISIPHFGKITIPSNVHIIGTMNNVDKSLVSFDLALRRRFSFYKLMPDVDVLFDWNEKRRQKNDPQIESSCLEKYIKNCDELNKSLGINDNLGINGEKYCLNLPEDFKIGHAYFMKIVDFATPQGDETLLINSFSCERLWDFHIEPLLEEYLGMEFADQKGNIVKIKKHFIDIPENKDE